MIDIRENIIENALKFAIENGVNADVYVMNALDIYKLGRYNIVLMYGCPLAHFNE